MGNIFTTFYELIFGIQEDYSNYLTNGKFIYAVFDPLQTSQPQGRSKDLISSKHRKSPNTLDTVSHIGCNTVWKCFKRTAWKYPTRPFLGVRESQTNQHMYQSTSGDYKWMTFEEVDTSVEHLSRVIIKRQFCPIVESNIEGTPSIKMMGIFSENRLEWFQTELACCSDSVCIVPIAYEPQFLVTEQIAQVINTTEITTLCVSVQTIRTILDLKSKQKIPKLTTLILFDEPQDMDIALASQVGFEIYSFKSLMHEGSITPEQERVEPKGNTILLIGITSGSTGIKKLAMLTHMNFISGQVAQEFLGFEYTCEDVYLSYVPLTHVYEQIMHIDATMFGFRIGYSSNDTSLLINDIQNLKPTLFGSFPQFYNKIYKLIIDKIDEESRQFLQTCIQYAIKTKMDNYMEYGKIKHVFYDMFFSQIRNMMGGRIRFFVSGGAPLSIEVKNFLTVVFSAPIFEAYGMTEAAGCLSSTSYWDKDGGHVGGTLPCNRMQLRDVPKLGIYTENPNGSFPVGEIFVKGNSVFQGYYKNPQLTKEVLDEDGWLKVGDIGVLNPATGSIRVIDRVGEVKKLQNGQFIVPQKLENIYINCPMIDQIYVDINPNSQFLVAIVTLIEDKLKQFANVNGIEGNISQLGANSEVQLGILKQLEKQAIANKLDNVEKIIRIHIISDRFTVENGLLTNKQTLKRSEIKMKYSSVLDSLYSEGGNSRSIEYDAYRKKFN